MIYTREAIGVTRAKAVGMMDEVISAQHFDSELARLTDSILKWSPFSLRRSK